MVKKGDKSKGFAILGMILFGLLSWLLNPLIHGAIAWVFGWGFIQGTTAIGILTVQNFMYQPPLIEMWLYFMLPSLLLYVLYLTVAIFITEAIPVSILLTIFTELTMFVAASKEAELVLIGSGYSGYFAVLSTLIIQLGITVAYLYLFFGVYLSSKK